MRAESPGGEVVWELPPPGHNDNTVESVLLAVAFQACNMLDLCM